MSNSIYSIHNKLSDLFYLDSSDNPITNSVFNEIPEDSYYSWGAAGVSSWNKGVSPSKETREKISKTNKEKDINWVSNGATEAARQYNLGKKQSPEHIHKRISKRFRKVEVDGIVYDSLKSASIALRVNITAISGRLTRGKSAKYLD